VTFEITAKGPLPLSEMQRISSACNDFLSVVAHGYCRATNTSIIPTATVDGKKQLGTYIAVPFYKTRKRVKPNHFLFPASAYPERFAELISTWLKSRFELQDTRALYMWGVYGSGFIETKLVALTAAAEAFHRQFNTGLYRSQEEFDDTVFQPLSKALPTGVSPDHRDSILARLKFANEFSQRKRLHELFKEYDEVLRHLDPKPRDLVNPIIDLRNEYTHFPAPSVENRHRGRIESNRVVHYNWVLRLLLESCFLQRMGLAHSEVVRIVRSSDDYRQVAELLKR
jgi:hypothetical protein